MSGSIINHYIAKNEGRDRLKFSQRAGLVQVEINEGERLFEKLVIGQSYKDIPFITARICGVCSTSHIFAATLAIEDAFGVEINDAILNLRRALQAAQIVQSHTLHAFFLALPDYLGAKSGLDLDEKNPRLFKLAISLKSISDEVIEKIGGRLVHPVTPTVGGFLSIPKDAEIQNLIAKVRTGQRLALETLELFAGLKYPYLKRPTEYFSLTRDDKVDIFGDRLISTGEVDAAPADYQFIIKEKVKPGSSAKFATHNGHGLMVGALARVNMMEIEDFMPKTQAAIKEFGIKIPMINSFKNNLAQAIEISNYLEIIEQSLSEYLLGKKMRTKVGFKVKAGTGVGAVEAPGGTLYHMYEFDENGVVTRCDIVTPTVQNLTNLEDDGNEYLKQNKSVTIPRRERELGMLVRAYDLCVACAVH